MYQNTSLPLLTLFTEALVYAFLKEKINFFAILLTTGNLPLLELLVKDEETGRRLQTSSLPLLKLYLLSDFV